MDIAEAIRSTAQVDDPAIARLIEPRAVSSDRRVASVRRLILRFLQNVPEDVTVLELRQAIEDD